MILRRKRAEGVGGSVLTQESGTLSRGRDTVGIGTSRWWPLSGGGHPKSVDRENCSGSREERYPAAYRLR